MEDSSEENMEEGELPDVEDTSKGYTSVINPLIETLVSGRIYAYVHTLTRMYMHTWSAISFAVSFNMGIIIRYKIAR